MGNKDLLTEDEFLQFRPHPLLLVEIESCRNGFQLDKNAFRIVDWGCGRGKFVLWLLEHGYNATGVDPDDSSFQNGADLFARKGYEIRNHLYRLNENGDAPFGESTFHFVTSNQVFEHVKGLESLINEIRRVTVKGGGGFHLFPPHKRIIEGHLFMPFVHWLPKNKLRKYMIFFFVCAGIEPHWWQKGKMPLLKKVNSYYQFSIQDTFYRTYKSVVASFEQEGFTPQIVDVREDIVRRFAYRFLFQKPTSLMIRTWYTNFGGDLGLRTVLHSK
jgi:SAM-dependent methyltransferase